MIDLATDERKSDDCTRVQLPGVLLKLRLDPMKPIENIRERTGQKMESRLG